jgi:phosphate transport system substrate-binding protein
MGTFSTQVSKQANANQANSASQTEILVAGSTTVDPITQAAAKVYTAANPGIKVNSQAVGSGAGIQAVGTGVADIGASSDGVSYAQNAQFPQLQSTLIGYGAIVPISYYDGIPADEAWVPGTSNPLTIADLDSLFNTAHNTQATDISGTPVVVYRADSSGTAKTLQGYITGVLTPAGISGLSQWTNVGQYYNGTVPAQGTAVGVNGNQAMVQTVSTTKNSIGYADYGDAVSGVMGGNMWIPTYTDGVATYTFTQPNSTANQLTEWNALRGQAHNEYKYSVEVPGAFASSNLKASNYTLLRQLFYVTNGVPNSAVQNFINFVKNDPRDPNNANNYGVFQETNNFGIPDVA